jgi:hypothetical protein
MAPRKRSSTGTDSWARKEFGETDFGDERLGERLTRIADRLADSPESPINQACENWAETKAAYRFFQNENVSDKQILLSHVSQTVQRAKEHQTILAIQDTSYFSYTDHEKTTGLGILTKKPGSNIVSAKGITMHTSFAVTTTGLPLGILDQKIYARKEIPEPLRKLKRANSQNIPINSKESFRWLECLEQSQKALKGEAVQVVTVCDREADIYDLFELADRIKAPVLIRADKNRIVNKASKCSEVTGEWLAEFVKRLPCSGKIQVEIPAKDNKPGRMALLEVRFGNIAVTQPRNHTPAKNQVPRKLQLNAICVEERHPPKGEEALEWILLTDLEVKNFNQAVEKIRWYCLRWRIEVFHKILKSGLNVEQCRLATADRLIRYLTVMSVIAWRIFWITLLGRSYPDLPCTQLLAEEEWQVLSSKITGQSTLPQKPPSIREAIRWIAQLGGFLARKGDGEPGIITIWRGWKRLSDLSEGWSLAHG